MSAKMVGVTGANRHLKEFYGDRFERGGAEGFLDNGPVDKPNEKKYVNPRRQEYASAAAAILSDRTMTARSARSTVPRREIQLMPERRYNNKQESFRNGRERA